MTNANDPKKYLKDLALSSSEEQSLSAVVSKITSEPESVFRVEPPAGYEALLLAKLSRELPEMKVVASAKTRAQQTSGSFSFFKSPQLAWIFSGTFALVLVLVSMNQGSVRNEMAQQQGNTLDQSDVLARTVAAENGGQAAETWIALAGGSSRRGVDAATQGMSDQELDQVFQQVAAELSKKL